MSELSKCLQGKQFNCIDDELVSIITKARRLTKQYNQTKFEDTIQKDSILSELFAKIGNNVKIDVPFYCDYGQHISIGNNVIININCTFVDCNKITIGNNVLIASNVQIYTATHPVNISDRLLDNWSYNNPHAFFNTYALPVTIEDNVWIGGGVIILPGVTIGKNSVIGAGSVVNKSIPPNSLAVGNPCKVIRKINNKN
ncbi:MAG: sugar O-acetyltransferase [Megamonas funiformis]|jgi:maltose O-acetyltransferase|uniref:Sugar O-acetyltransferase n=1 Tax=Megamonas funiformis TaxID=437897 RepID=A0AAW4U3D7_9FIRM|nr:sugar O-acetyltransferase [Megamonas funiformis]MBS7211034.1 sugar O-acetyltransferase [Megamonas funiformis]MCB6827159.1 sugar O-acetyltransferase [Megamonas funiformis]